MSIPSLTSIPTTQPSCGDISLDRPFQPCPDTAFITPTGNSSEPQGCFVQPAGFFCAPLSTTRGFLYQDDNAPSQNSIISTHANAPSVYIPRFHAPTNDNSSRPSPPLLAVDGQPIRYGGVARLGQACIGVPLPDATILTTDPRFQTMITLAQRRLTEALKGGPGSTSSGAAAWSPGAAADGSSIFSLWGDCEEGAFCDFSQATQSPSGDKIGTCREQLPNYHECSSYMQCSSRRCDVGSVAGRTGNNPLAVGGTPAAAAAAATAAESVGEAVAKGSSPRPRRRHHHRGRSLEDVDSQPPTVFLSSSSSSSSTDHSRALQNQRRAWPARLALSERRLGSVPVCLPSNIYHDNTSNGNPNDGIHFSGNGNGTQSNDHGASSESDQESNKARVSIWIGALLGMVAILVGIFLLGLLRRRQKLRRDKQQQQQQQSQSQQQLQQRQLQVHHHRRKHRSRSKSIKRTNTNPGPDFEPEPTSDLALEMDREEQSPLALGSIHKARGADGVADEKNRFYMMDQTRRGGYGDDGDDDSQFMYHLSTATTTMTTTSVGGQDERKPDSDSRFARFWSRLRKAEQSPPPPPSSTLEANDEMGHPEGVISGRRRSKGHSHHGLKGPSKRSELASQTRSVAPLTFTTNSSFYSSSHSLPLPSPLLEANLSSPGMGLESQLGGDRMVQGRGMDTIMDMEEEDPSRAGHVNWSNLQDQRCFSEGEMMDSRGSSVLAPPSPLHVSPISPPPVSNGGGGGSSRSSSRMLKRQSAAQQQATAASAMGTETSKG